MYGSFEFANSNSHGRILGNNTKSYKIFVSFLRYLLAMFIHYNFTMKILFAIVIFFCKTTSAAIYYVSNISGQDSYTSGEAQNQATPWRTLNKLNSFDNLKPGDSVLLKKGEIFYGTLIVRNSGITGKVIFYGSYGEGKNPIISGFTIVSQWSLLRGNIYYTPLDLPELNIVTVDGIVKGIGRYPNHGYLSYESHSNNSSITDNQLTNSPNWTGAEVVIRKYRWVLDRHMITNHAGHTLTYNALASYGNNNAYSPLDGNGYFIQGHIATLDSLGEWYYDKLEKRLYMHFGTGTPAGKVVKVSSLDRNFTINSQNNITINDINFEGSNTHGGYLVAANDINLKNCNFTQQGGNALYGIDVSYLTVNGGAITEVLNNGIWVENNGSYINVNGTTVSNVGTIAGAGKSGDDAQEGVSINGNNTTITDCSVINTGFNGIAFSGNNALIGNNYVDSFCTIKDDGGGIYTYTGNNALIKNNIVLHAIGAYAGAEWSYWEPFGKAVGIYLDNGSPNHYATVTGNTVAHGDWGGIFINSNGGNTIVNNTIFDFAEQLLLSSSSAGTIRNTTILNNKFIAKTSEQRTLYNQMYVNDSPSLFGTIDSNYYARPIDDSLSIQTTSDGGTPTFKTVAGWQKYAGVDFHSRKSPKLISTVEDLRFEYNTSSRDKTVTLDSSYIDVTGAVYSKTITLGPHSSAVLINIKDDAAVTATPNAPTLSADDNANMLAASHPLGDSVILVCENGGPYLPYTGLINVSNIARASGYWKFKIKSAPQRNESAVTNSPAFTITSTILPLTFTQIKAYKHNKGIQVDWIVASETNIDRYEVEKSVDGRLFAKAATVGAKGNINTSIYYNWLDVSPNTANNFYRIKAIEKFGSMTYTKVVNVQLENKKSGISIFPNPITGGVAHLQLTDKAKGIYNIVLINNVGQDLFMGKIDHPGGSSTYMIPLSRNMCGLYELQIWNKNIDIIQKILVNNL